jgi:predicted TIM-barrel fold metal-dependent hydrolase
LRRLPFARIIGSIGRGPRRAANNSSERIRNVSQGRLAMGIFLNQDDLARTEGAENSRFRSPVPTRVVSNGEFTPIPQTVQQKQVEARIGELADQYGARQGLDRRRFLQTSCGMATAFLAMNQVFGRVFEVSEAEASQLEVAQARSGDLAGQFIFDVQSHFIRDDFTQEGLLGLGEFASQHWNPEMLKDIGLSLDRYRFDNFLKEIYLDSETDLALLSGAPFDDPEWWLLTNDQIAKARDVVTSIAGSKRLFAHSVVTPGQDGWMDMVEHAIADLKPDSWKGYTIGDPLGPSRFPWRLDDEELVYPFYERIVEAGITTVCIHKGLLPQNYEEAFPGTWAYATVDDVPKAAKDWPEITFVMYHSALRPFLELPDAELAHFEETGEIRWASDLARIPQEHGVTNVYAELGTSFANSAVADPRFCAAFVGTLVQGMGADHVLWGTDSVWYGSPQWQIEAMRRLEIPEDMQQKHGFRPLGPANGAIKNAIFGLNAARLYNIPLTMDKASVDLEKAAITRDTIQQMRAEYQATGGARTNLAYGYVAKTAA